jgi:hypothetical protein
MTQTPPTVDELVGARAHFDGSFHVGGHPGEPWPEHKCLVLTKDGQTWLCLLRDGAEIVTPVGSVREGLEAFAAELAAAIGDLPPTE